MTLAGSWGMHLGKRHGYSMGHWGARHTIRVVESRCLYQLTPFGDLQLSSGDDGQLVFVAHPGTDEQAVSFLTLRDASGQHVSGLDDAVFATAPRGVFYLADTGHNRVVAIQADDLEVGSLFASVGSMSALVSADLRSANVSQFVGNFNGPHGLVSLGHVCPPPT